MTNRTSTRTTADRWWPLVVGAVVLAMLGGFAWLIVWAIGQEKDPPGRPWVPSGAQGVWTTCSDDGHRLYRRSSPRTLAAVDDPSCIR